MKDMTTAPPHDEALEQAVLGQCLLGADALSDVMDYLRAEHFYVAAHQSIYKSLVRLADNGDPVNILTVAHNLRQQGELDAVGGPFYISQLTNGVANTSDVGYHARLLLQMFVLREVVRVGATGASDGMDASNDPFEVLEKLMGNLSDLQESVSLGKRDDIAEAVQETFRDLDKQVGGDAIPTNITSLNNILGGGLRMGDMTTIAARPGMGKTAFALSLLECLAVAQKVPCAIFSCEMNAVRLTQRLISQGANVPAELIRTRNLSDNEMVRMQSYGSLLAKAPLHIIESAGFSVSQVRTKCERLKRKGVKLAVIDHIGLLSAPFMHKGGTRENEVGVISRMLKQIAAKLDMCIIALSQLSRAVEHRTDHRPSLSDLRDSGSIEQDSDQVIFIYRPAYYGEDDGSGSTELIIAKQREGALGTVHAYFDNSTTAFRSSNDAPF